MHFKKNLKSLWVLGLLMIGISSFAQNTDPRYKKYAGRYGSSDGFALFEDGRFLLYGYATAVLGSYFFEKDYLLFYPDKPDFFEVYATLNPGIGDNISINFLGFEKGETYVQLDNRNAQKVFNKDANCFSAPFVYKAIQAPSKIAFFTKLEYHKQQEGVVISYTFSNDKKYNDFIFIYNRPIRYYEDFSGMIKEGETPAELQLFTSAYPRENGFVRQFEPGKEDNWQSFVHIKESIEYSNKMSGTTYVNKHYKAFDVPDSTTYRFDAGSNQYIHKGLEERKTYFRQNKYSDDSYLRKYVKLTSGKKESSSVIPKSINAKPIFYTTCEEPDKSYKYNGNEVPDSEETTTPLQKTVVLEVPIYTPPPPSLAQKSILEDDDFESRKPDPDKHFKQFERFKIERKEDGFYKVLDYNPADFQNSKIALKPTLIKKDIEDLRVGCDNIGRPVINIKFTTEGAKKFEKLSTESVGKPIAIIIDKTVIVMPIVNEPIKGGRCQISVESVEEAQRLIETLKEK